MLYELPYRRMLLLTEGQFGVFTSKTAMSMLRYRGGDVVGILDSAYSEGSRFSFEGSSDGWPVVARVADGLALGPDAVAIGIAPAGGALPEVMRRHLVDGLKGGLSIVSGLHTMLGEDPELAALAEGNGVRIHDVREPGPIERIAQGRARQSRAKRVLTVGTDCAIGKMVASLELRRAAVEAGLDAAFVPTGQTGIMIEGWGIAIDHVLSDFTAGAAELFVEQVADREVCFIEGQGSIGHPGYSGVTLSLLHGTCPDAMVMCHRPDRTHHHDLPDCPVASITRQIALYEQALSPLHDGRVAAVAVNTAGMSSDAADAAVAGIAAETGLPTGDPVRSGCGELLAAVRERIGI